MHFKKIYEDQLREMYADAMKTALEKYGYQVSELENNSSKIEVKGTKNEKVVNLCLPIFNSDCLTKTSNSIRIKTERSESLSSLLDLSAIISIL